MSLDLNILKQKLNELTNKTKVSDIIWKPVEGSNLIRIVPSHENPSFPFTELMIHYIGGKSYLSPNTFGEPDPIEEFAQHLRSGGQLSREDYAETKKFVPKLRTFAPIIVRGKEAEGVKFWGFGKTTYTELLSFINDPDYGDIVDVKTGRDVKIEFTPAEKSDTHFPKSKIKVNPNVSVAVKDAALLNTILTVQPNLFDVYKKLTYDELKVVLDRHLAPSANGGVAAVSKVEADDDWADSAPVITATTTAERSAKIASKTPKDVIEDFDAIFNK